MDGRDVPYIPRVLAQDKYLLRDDIFDSDAHFHISYSGLLAPRSGLSGQRIESQ